MTGSPSPVDWGTAERVAVRIAGREPFAESYPKAALEREFTELTAQAEELVAAATGLRSLTGAARARVVDRGDWVRVNLASFQRLLRPLTDKLGDKVAEKGHPNSRLAGLGRRAAGAEVGVVLGWMSSRVLGQYDLLLVEEEDPDDQDVVYYVGPNVMLLERRYAFPPAEFRLWLALHEVTHRAQFTGVPWLRPHFLSQIEVVLDQVDTDPRHYLESLKRAAGDARAGRSPLDDGGLAVVFATPEQREALDRLSALMSLLEGHGDVTMDRAGAAELPSSARFGKVLKTRRQQARGLARLAQRLVGLEAKLAQYAAGERFIARVEAEGGRELFDRVWGSPEQLPSMAEIRDPDRWIERMSSSGRAGDAFATPA